jgi:uncharacterized protein
MNTLRKLFVLAPLLSALVLCHPATAQQPAPGAAPPPAAIAAATELLQALGTESQFQAVLPVLFNQMRQVMVAANPAAGKELDEIMPRMQEKFASRKADVVPMLAQVYARRLPIEDMKAMTVFFRSPAGQRFVATQPQLMQESVGLGQEWGRRLGQDLERELKEELQKRGVRL